VDSISGETSFFRHPNQITTFEKIIDGNLGFTTRADGLLPTHATLGVQLLPTPSELHRAEHGGCGYTGHGQLTARRENALETLGQSENFDPKTRAELRGAGRLLMRILPFLQVGDRTQQKTEALRATLQELSDNLLRTEKEAPD